MVRDFQQLAVGGMRDGILLHCRAHDHALELLRLDGLAMHGSLDRGLEQQLQPPLPRWRDESARSARHRSAAKAHAAEVLPIDALRPALHQFLVAEVEAVLQVQQSSHQANRQARAAGATDASSELDRLGTEQDSAISALAGRS